MKISLQAIFAIAALLCSINPALAEQATKGINILVDLFIAATFPGYFILQILTLLWWQRGWRIAALVPVIVFGLVLIQTYYAYAANSNLWPIGIFVFMPYACLYLLLLFGVHWLMGRLRKSKA
jgi:hypothetical protein